MAIFSKLTKSEVEMIYDYIYLHGSRSGSVQPIAPITKLLKPWEEAKEKYLYQLMGENLILSKEISFQKTISEIEDTIRENVTQSYRYHDANTPCRVFLNAWAELAMTLSNKYDNSELHWALSDLISNRVLASNRYHGIEIEIPLPNDKKYRLLNNAKASKAIGKIAIAYGLPKYEEFRIAHSQALNEKSLTGEICMSIHPMDYMTMSDNDCGWGSCMSWYDHGDYRQGTVEMMNSPMVVVVYLKSSTDFICNEKDNQSWNSKRWRELFIVTPEIIAGIKGYPYWNSELESIALEWIKETISNSGVEGFGPYGDNIVTYDAHDNVIEINDECHPTLDFGTNLMYNDFYEEHHMFVTTDINRIPTYINYSGMSECMSCGEPLQRPNQIYFVVSVTQYIVAVNAAIGMTLIILLKLTENFIAATAMMNILQNVLIAEILIIIRVWKKFIWQKMKVMFAQIKKLFQMTIVLAVGISLMKVISIPFGGDGIIV